MCPRARLVTTFDENDGSLGSLNTVKACAPCILVPAIDVLQDVFAHEAVIGDVSSGGRSSKKKYSSGIVGTTESNTGPSWYDGISTRGLVVHPTSDY
jgi:hypothetical protein